MFLQIRRRIKLDGAELEEYVKRKQDQEQEDIRRKVELALKYVHLLATRLPQLPPHPLATMTTDIKSLSPCLPPSPTSPFPPSPTCAILSTRLIWKLIERQISQERRAKVWGPLFVCLSRDGLSTQFSSPRANQRLVLLSSNMTRKQKQNSYKMSGLEAVCLSAPTELLD